MLEDTHFKARQAIIEIAHPRFGMLKMQNVAPRLSDTPGSIRSVGPELGEHNHEMLVERLKLDVDTVRELQEKRVIGRVMIEQAKVS